MNTDNPEIDQLVVAHRLRDAAGHGMPAGQAALLSEKGLYLGTCLRELVIIADGVRQIPRLQMGTGLEWHRGLSAYSFLLQTATGLNSNVPGETNILGQFRFAWNEWRQRMPSRRVYRLQSVMQRLFADSKRIRNDYLQGIGGNSYGSLVRKLLSPDNSERLLFVGTGELARSMTTFFDSCEVAAWNHKPTTPLTADARLFAPAQSTEAASWATRIIITSPADNTNDSLWFRLATCSKDIVHLGRRRGDPGIWSAWSGPANYFDLDSVFDLRKHQSSLRSLQILRARKACESLARQSKRCPSPPLATARRAYA